MNSNDSCVQKFVSMNVCRRPNYLGLTVPDPELKGTRNAGIMTLPQARLGTIFFDVPQGQLVPAN